MVFGDGTELMALERKQEGRKGGLALRISPSVPRKRGLALTLSPRCRCEEDKRLREDGSWLEPRGPTHRPTAKSVK